MKTVDITRVVGFGLLVIVAAALLAGCSTEYQAYPGPPLPPDQTCTLKVPWRNGNSEGMAGATYLWVSAVDETKRHALGGTDTVIRLLPGKHTISFKFTTASMGTDIYSPAPFHKVFYAEAGKTYMAVLHVEYPAWEVEIKPEK